MKHVLTILFSVIVFGLSTTFLVLGRHAIGSSVPLLLVIVAGYIIALGAAFPAQSDIARAQCVAWYRAWKSGAGGAP